MHVEQGEAPAATHQALRAKIEYAIVALHLSAKRVAQVVNDASGVDATMPDFLRALKTSQLEAIWKRLSGGRFMETVT